MKYILPIVLIVIAIAVFFVFANPLFGDIKSLGARATSYNDALSNSKMLENERDKLTATYNSIDPENLRKLERFLPENVDNIRLILEIEQIAAPYGMSLKDVKYNTEEGEGEDASRGTVLERASRQTNKEYGIFDLEFSISGRYEDFINFTRDLENNLRIVDIASIAFTSESVAVVAGKVQPSDIYKYNFKIKTYWLKN